SFEEIRITCGETTATVAPARGALVASLRVRGRDALFLDRASFEDATQNVRGGIPVLFPFAGRLDGDVLRPTGTQMKQHGVGRREAWTAAARQSDSLSVRLASSDATRAVYPFEFVAEQTTIALARGLHVELLVTNRGERQMPLSPGWHPYFACP